MPKFSIIVPYLDDAQLFDDTLASVLRYRPENAQVIVAHDGLYDDPHQLLHEVDFAVTARRAQLIRLFNIGVQIAHGDFVALIRPGIELDEGWEFPVLDCFESDRVGSVSPIIASPLKPSRIVTAGVNKEFGYCRQLVAINSPASPRRLKQIGPLGPTSWAAFYRKSVLDQVGSCDEILDPVYLDLELALAFHTLGYRCQFEPECQVFIDRSTPILREALTAHGRSAERAVRRHSKDNSFGRTLMTVTAELIRSPLRPWYLQHALQRFGAGRLADIDQHFADKMAQKNRQRNWEGEQIHQTLRRAA